LRVSGYPGWRLEVKRFLYTVATTKSFDAAVDALEKKVVENGFQVIHTYDVAASLRSEGISHGPLKIVEVCNVRYANEALQRDINVALMLPCPIVVYTDAGETLISTMRASALTTFCPDSDLGEIAASIEKVVRQIIDQAAAFPVPSTAERAASVQQSDEVSSTRAGGRIAID
jgi:uncharacterized protein (DUF302 family)